MYLLLPGRHHLLTQFQFEYIQNCIQHPEKIEVISGEKIAPNTKIEAIIFAVTSSNHSGTKRNPIPFYQRVMIIQEFCDELPIPGYIYGINDVGHIEDFADYTIKTIAHESERNFVLTPENTLVICSTPVLNMYQNNGFTILPAELNPKQKTYDHALPWDLIEKMIVTENWTKDADFCSKLHASTHKIWTQYQLDKKVKNILSDPIIGEDGDITESRDYNSYVRQMDEIAELKFLETAPFIQSGNIGDIGCAVGSWIKLASEEDRFAESDFYGIELARQLFDFCLQRKNNKEFKNPSVFFSMKNAVTSLVFEPNSMDTIHTSSLTHEIESYGSRADLLAFIENRYTELKSGGVWINRDVVGPENGQKLVYMQLNAEDGSNENPFVKFTDKTKQSTFLKNLSTYARFLRFAHDFRQKEGDTIDFKEYKNHVIELKYRDAADYMYTKDYTDNWDSEMHETFTFWSFSDWEKALKKVGFRIRTESKSYQNSWIIENRIKGKIEVFADAELSQKITDTPTNMLLVAQRV